jgi:hypothetical protein
MGAAGDNNRTGVVTVKQYPDPRSLPAQPSWQARPQLTIGWLLDIAIEQNVAVLWIRTIDERLLRLTDTYHPSLYILPKDERAGSNIEACC